MRRRKFITLLGGAVAWPFVARAQQSERTRRVGVLLGVGAGDAEYQRRIAGLKQGLRDLNWVEGRNIVFDVLFADGKPERLPTLAGNLVEAKSDVIVTSGSGPTDAVRKQTRTVPIVMVGVGDAVGTGFISSLAHPGGNITGETHVATEQSAKRLELLKETCPTVTRIAVISNG